MIVRRRAEAPHRDAKGALLLPSLTVTCYRGQEILLSLEADEAMADGEGSGPAEIHVIYQIGSDPPGPPASRLSSETRRDPSHQYLAGETREAAATSRSCPHFPPDHPLLPSRCSLNRHCWKRELQAARNGALPELGDSG